MARFLSPEWLDEMDRAARDAHVSGEPLLIEHAIDDDGHEVRYHLAIGADGARVIEGGAAEPTVTFLQDRQTAAAIARGELRAQHALSVGRVRLRGDAGALTDRRDDLARLEAAFEPVRRATRF